MKFPTKTFTITCTMNERWIPHFLGSLRQMQVLGEQGSSREVAIYADGDGDFRPKFEWNSDMPIPAAPARRNNVGDVIYDAG
jgi:hypothetical protein